MQVVEKFKSKFELNFWKQCSKLGFRFNRNSEDLRFKFVDQKYANFKNLKEIP